MSESTIVKDMASGALQGAAAAVALVVLLLSFDVNGLRTVVSQSSQPSAVILLLTGLVAMSFAVGAGLSMPPQEIAEPFGRD